MAQNKARKRKADGGEATPSTRAAAPVQVTGILAGLSSDVKGLRELIETAGGADELIELIGPLSGLLGKNGAAGLTELIQAIS